MEMVSITKDEPAAAKTISARSVPVWLALAALGAVAACLFMVRLTAPPNLCDHDQERPAAYVLDAVQNGHWICQRDLDGDIASKPPFWTWLSALTTEACGRISVFSLDLPGALAALGTAWLVYSVGRRHFGGRAAFFGAMALLLTSGTLKEIGLARSDGVFSLTVAVCAFLAFDAWTTERGWTWFWVVAAVSTLTKGPLGVVLAGSGLLAVLWERKSGHSAPLRGSHAAGIAIFLAIVGGWFLLAYRQFGHALVAKMLVKELAQHAVTDGSHTFVGMHFYQPPLYFMSHAAPGSLFACIGFWRVWKSPAQSDDERRFERFLFCWFLPGLVIFSLSSTQRADYLWPLFPAATLLAGRELDCLTRALRPNVLYVGTVAVVLLAMAIFAGYYFAVSPRQPMVRQTVALRKLADEIERRGLGQFSLAHVDDPMTLQIYLNTLSPRISIRRAAELLGGTKPVFIAVNDMQALQSACSSPDPLFYTLLPDPPDPDCPTRIVSNRPLPR